MLPSYTTPAAHLPVACPRCGAPMRILEREGVVVDQCRGCGGVFLDHGELERLAAIERWDADDDDDDDDDDDRRRARRSSRRGEWRELSPAAAGTAGWGAAPPAPQPWPAGGPVLGGQPPMPPAPMPPPYPGIATPPPMPYPDASYGGPAGTRPADPRVAAAGGPRPAKKSGFLRDLLEGFGD